MHVGLPIDGIREEDRASKPEDCSQRESGEDKLHERTVFVLCPTFKMSTRRDSRGRLALAPWASFINAATIRTLDAGDCAATPGHALHREQFEKGNGTGICEAERDECRA